MYSVYKYILLTHLCPPLRSTFAAPLKPLRVDSALRALSTLRSSRGAPEVPPLCRETQSLGQQMLNAPFGINGLINKLFVDDTRGLPHHLFKSDLSDGS